MKNYNKSINGKVRLKNVSKSFEGDNILKNISFEVKEGEFASLLGPSGVVRAQY